MITIQKGRPWKSYRVRFTNDDILQWDSVGFYQLVPAAPLGFAWSLRDLAVNASIVVDYGNVNAAGAAFINADFDTVGCAIENDPGPMGGFQLISYSSMLTPGNPISLGHPGRQDKYVDTGFRAVDQEFTTFFTSLADIVVEGGVYLFVTNGGSGDLTGGDPQNFIDFWLMLDMIPLT